MHRSKHRRYSMTSSARASNEGGTSIPSCLAALRLRQGNDQRQAGVDALPGKRGPRPPMVFAEHVGPVLRDRPTFANSIGPCRSRTTRERSPPARLTVVGLTIGRVRFGWHASAIGIAVMPVQTQADYYRSEAKRCAERAKTARNSDTKQRYEEMARQWLDLAKRADEGGGGA
jgi:hypothetical protein